MIGLALLGLARASPVDTSTLRPVIARIDTPERYVRWRSEQGLPPERLVCELLWVDIATLCFRVWEGRPGATDSQRRWVTDADIARWDLTAASMRDLLARDARAHMTGAELVPIEGTSAKYLRLVDADGWAAAFVLQPEGMSDKLGAPPLRLAIPSEGVAVAWKVQSPEIDQVMAIGVRELYEQLPGPVSPRILTWDGSKFTPFGQAVPAMSISP